MSKSIVVKIVGDRAKEPTETLALFISTGFRHVRIKERLTQGKIVNDD